MKRTIAILVAAATMSAIAMMWLTPGRADGEGGSPIFGVTIPEGYRRWELVAVAHESGLDELRGILGNAVATKAYLEGTLPRDGLAIHSRPDPCNAPVDRHDLSQCPLRHVAGRKGSSVFCSRACSPGPLH